MVSFRSDCRPATSSVERRPRLFLRTLRVTQSPPNRGGSPVSYSYGMGDPLERLSAIVVTKAEAKPRGTAEGGGITRP
jgi:hypothetical protein